MRRPTSLVHQAHSSQTLHVLPVLTDAHNATKPHALRIARKGAQIASTHNALSVLIRA